MAETVTTPGLITSFGNTPQANADSYAYTEEQLAADSDGVIWLDVMSNDLGGKAKTLYSIAAGADLDGDSDIDTADLGELLTRDLAGYEELTTLGATIWIGTDPADGKVKVAYQPGNLFESLAAGETATDTFRYAIRLANGALSWDVVTIVITGTNDAPTISAADDTGAVTEDDSDPVLSDTGTITFDDVDLTDTHSVIATADAGNGLGGALDVSVTDAATGAGDGTVTWTYKVNNSATQYLADGETAEEKFTVKISDNNGGYVEQLVTVTVTGTNDDPTISVADDAGAVTEDDTDPVLSDGGTITFDDVDLSDGHTVSAAADAGNSLGGVLEVSVTDDATGAGDGTVTWTYKVNNSATQYLANGETAEEKFTVTIDDGNGGTVDQLVTVTITGTNDDPVITLEAGDSASAELTDGNSDLSVSGSLTATDIDVSDVMTATVQSVAFGGTGGVNGMTNAQLLSLFSILPLAPTGIDTNLTTSGQINWSFDAAANLFDYLSGTDSLVLTYTVQVDDGNGGTDTQEVSITINGVNESTAVTVPPPFTGTGDPNDFDNLGPAAGSVVTKTTVSGQDEDYNGTNGADTINAGNGDDTVYGHDGDDTINGENGADTSLYGQGGDDIISGGTGGDEIFGGSGDDELSGDNGSDKLYGGSGSDIVVGGDDGDIIIGGYGADTLTGGGGADTFRYLSVLDTGDVITDFEGAGIAGGDVIDLSAIATVFGGTTATANGAWYATDGTNATVYVDTDGNTATAEFAITLNNVTSLIASDFDLTP